MCFFLFVEFYVVQLKTEIVCTPEIAKSSRFKMKDIIANRNLINKDTIYKEVVIIGNGPSGISLSYMLAGNWPYWSPDRKSVV